MFTGEGKHTVKVGNHPHTNSDKKKPSNCEKRRVQMRDIGNTFEIKRSTAYANLLYI